MPPTKRRIYDEERSQIQGLLKMAGASFALPEYVIQLDDGGMGSLQFTDEIVTPFDSVIDVTYIDSDNTPVLIDLRASNNSLTEIDFWKVDFSGLKKYPTIEEVKRTEGK